MMLIWKERDHELSLNHELGLGLLLDVKEANVKDAASVDVRVRSINLGVASV